MLDRWLSERAWKNESRFSRTFVVCAGEAVAGFYCLAAGSVERAAAPGALRRNAPDHVPVAILGRLAVAREFQGRGLGADLLADAIRRVSAAAESIAISALLVQAKDEAAKRFYLRCAEFVEFPGESRTLFLRIAAT